MGFVFSRSEFVIAKNRLFVLPCNKDALELLGIIKVNSSTALMLDLNSQMVRLRIKWYIIHGAQWKYKMVQQQKIIVITILQSHNIQNIKVVSCMRIS